MVEKNKSAGVKHAPEKLATPNSPNSAAPATRKCFES
jgi:hypothetical protein